MVLSKPLESPRSAYDDHRTPTIERTRIRVAIDLCLTVFAGVRVARRSAQNADSFGNDEVVACHLVE